MKTSATAMKSNNKNRTSREVSGAQEAASADSGLTSAIQKTYARGKDFSSSNGISPKIVNSLQPAQV